MNSDKKDLSQKLIDLSIVVPLFDEEESIDELYQEIVHHAEKTGHSFEIIFIDDGSTDKSFSILESLHQKDSRVKVVQFRKNFGKAEALSAGFTASQGKMVVTMDADLQDDPAEIPALITKLEEGYDLVSGWKKKRRDPLSKTAPSRLFNFTTARLTKIRIHDFNCGLKIYRREVIETLNLYGEMHRYIPVLANWEGFRISEIQVHHRKRKYGKTKYGLSRFLKGLLDLITILFLSKYTQRPLHLFGFVGFFSTILGGGIVLYLVILKILQKTFLSNRPLLFIGIVILIMGVQFISIGLLGEMIARSQTPSRTYSIRRSLGV